MITGDDWQLSICLGECRHLNSGLQLPPGLPAIDDHDEGALHPHQPEGEGLPLPAEVDGSEVWLRNGDCVPDDDSLAGTEIVQSDNHRAPALVHYYEGEGHRVLGVDTADHDPEDNLESMMNVRVRLC